MALLPSGADLLLGASTTLRLAELLHTYRPESWGGTRGDTWPEHARYLWALDPAYMQALATYMAGLDRWFRGPVIVDDGVVQDGHHRVITATELGWLHRSVPIASASCQP